MIVEAKIPILFAVCEQQQVALLARQYSCTKFKLISTSRSLAYLLYKHSIHFAVSSSSKQGTCKAILAAPHMCMAVLPDATSRQCLLSFSRSPSSDFAAK